MGLSYISASVNAFFKDAGQLVQVFLQMGMWLAPIMWAETLVPEKYRFIIKFNPFYYIVEGFRDCFISHEGFWERPVLSAYFWLVSIIIFVIVLTSIVSLIFINKNKDISAIVGRDTIHTINYYSDYNHIIIPYNQIMTAGIIC